MGMCTDVHADESIGCIFLFKGKIEHLGRFLGGDADSGIEPEGGERNPRGRFPRCGDGSRGYGEMLNLRRGVDWGRPRWIGIRCDGLGHSSPRLGLPARLFSLYGIRNRT